MRWTADRIMRWTLGTLLLAVTTWGIAGLPGMAIDRATPAQLGLPTVRLFEELPKHTVSVQRVSGSSGAHPSLTLEVRNVSDGPIHHMELWARFESVGRWSVVTPAVVAVDPLGARLFPGDARVVTLHPNLPREIDAAKDSLVTADIYWTFGRISPSQRGAQAPRMTGLRVAAAK